MKNIQARTLLKYSTEELTDILTGFFSVTFEDDVTIETNYREILYSSYLWDIHRAYPNIPILSTDHVQNATTNGVLTSGTYRKLLNLSYWRVRDTYNLKYEEDVDKLNKLVYDTVGNMYNCLINLVADHVTSIDLVDFMEVQLHPKLWDAMDKVTEQRDTIEHAHKVVIDVVSEETSLVNNALAKAARCGAVNKNQLEQCLGPRGFVTEVDSKILPVPVTRSFTQGMYDIYNLAAESRSAAKALYFSKVPLQDSETFAKQLQLITMVVENLHKGEDCGSKNLFTWSLVKPAKYDDTGRMIRKSDLHHLQGKNYLNTETGELETVTLDMTHLIGTSIQFRTIQFCEHPDKHGVCEVCFGGLSDSIVESANLGNEITKPITTQSTQSVLSVKHLDSSSKTEKVELPSDIAHFFRARNSIELLVGKSFTKTTKLAISPDYILGINDIKTVNNAAQLVPSRVSLIRDITIIDSISPSLPPITINASLDSSKRIPILTKECLTYMKKYGWEIDSNGAVILSFEHWNRKDPLFLYPEVEYSYGAHSNEISRIINGGEKATSKTNSDPSSTLALLHDLINSKLDINIIAIETVVYALSSPTEEDNFDLVRHYPIDERCIKPLLSTLFGRSLSAGMGYQRQAELVQKPVSFIRGMRPDHPHDTFIDPENVIHR